MGFVWVTVDVEAHPHRAPHDHVDRLVWGRWANEEFGIGRMMDIADYHGIGLTMFCDLIERDAYADAFDDVAREVVRRGHDLQLHAHTDFFVPAFWEGAGVSRVVDLNEVGPAQADAIAAELVRRHCELASSSPIAFRGGGYRYSDDLLRALYAKGVLLDSSVNRSRESQPRPLPAMAHFHWPWGMFEVPVSTIDGFRRVPRPLDFNFNSLHFSTPDAMLAYLDVFFEVFGPDAIAVLVMHSWSFLDIEERRHFGPPLERQVAKFASFLRAAGDQHTFVTAPAILELATRGLLRSQQLDMALLDC